MYLVYALIIEILQPIYKFLKFYFFYVPCLIFFNWKIFFEKRFFHSDKNILFKFIINFFLYSLYLPIVLIITIFWLGLPFLISWLFL